MSIAATTGALAAQATQATTAASKADAAKQAEAFERILVGQLTKTLADSALPEDSTSAATSTYKSMLPDALTEALMSGGGIGLARQLEQGLT
jgi:Rod binding domain-containing protein